MAVYLISFALSILLIAYAEKKRLPVFLGISAIALLIPCLVAGLRNEAIGTDVLVYVKPLTNAAFSAKDLGQYFDGYWFAEWRNLYVQNYEKGFSLMVYFVAKLTHSLSAVLFVIHAVMILPIFIALARNKKYFPVWLGMLIYYFLFFNASLNMMRQWNAMAFLLLSFQMLRERRFIHTAVFILLGMLFHTTAIVAVPLYLLYFVLWAVRRSEFVHNNLRVEGPSIVSGFLFLFAILMIMNLPIALKLLSMVGLGNYGTYLEGNDMRLMLGQIIVRLPLLVILLINWKSLRKTDRSAPFYLAVVLLDLVVSQLVSVDDNALRISSYLMMFAIFWVPSVYRSCETKPKRIVITAMIIGYAMFYWYYTYIYSMRHATYPYLFTETLR